ncbi:hypothetical protein H2200_012961 [Cladophialophora chaetospira]|uniref:Uncharacterized protein n=1 Tax=Cladophialophora chaetospira TaxID=386627 RepID=A0AA39CBM0_9EURO|nr:hypothetical protein H2200_012961 [Cladophialophora chaetospira]
MKFVNRTTIQDPDAAKSQAERVLPPEFPAIMLLLDYKVLQNGALHKMKLKPSLPTKALPARPKGNGRYPTPSKAPNPSPAELLAHSLIESMHHSRPGLELDSLSKYFGLLPSRVGCSAALDDTLRCLVSAHQLALHGVPINNCLDLNLYGRALQSIQKALENPAEYVSSSTLCAVSLIARLEATFSQNPSREITEMLHIKGFARLIQEYGVPREDDILGANVVLANVLTLVMYAIEQGEDCILIRPEWIRVLERPLGRPHFFLMGKRLYRMLIVWPTLLRQMKIHRLSPSTENLDALLLRLKSITALLSEIGSTVEYYMSDEKMVVIQDSVIPGSPVPKVYNFLDYNLPHMMIGHAESTIIINRMVSFLTSSPELREDIEMENYALSQRIWMAIEWARLRKPFGPRAVTSAVGLSVVYAPLEMRKWLVDMVNDLKMLPGGVKPQLTFETLKHQSLAVSGLCDFHPMTPEDFEPQRTCTRSDEVRVKEQL